MASKPRDPDYTLNVFHHLDEKTAARSVAFMVQTTKVFVSFRYDILLQAVQEDRTVRIKIQGLHAPELLMPGTGPARGWKLFEGLFGHYKVVVSKQDKSVNEFDVDVTDSGVTLLKAPEHPFILPSTDPVDLV
jgi:hypothetical protein